MIPWLFYRDYKELTEFLIKNNVRPSLIITDPPYDIPRINTGGSINTVKRLNKSLQDLNQSGLMNSYDIEWFAQAVIKLQPKRVNVYFWCNKKQLPNYIDIYVNNLGCKFEILPWHKTNALPTYSNKYLSDTEYCLFFHNGKAKCHPENYEDAKTYWVEPINHQDKKQWGHPTIKPLAFIEKLIRNSSKEGELVYDPFMGSGTTGVACKKLNRNFIGTDINIKYFELAKERIGKCQQ